jgi:SAM-dependent methyltransferase
VVGADSGRLIARDDVDGFSAEVRQLLENPEGSRPKRADAARRTRELYALPRLTAQLASLYGTLLPRPSAEANAISRDHARTYTFEPIRQCGMCGADSATATVLGRRTDRPQGLRPRARPGLTVTVMRCKRCRLVYTDPQPVPADLSDHYRVEPEDYWEGDYLDDTPGYFASQIATFHRLHGPGEHLKALDVGAGVGKGMCALRLAGFDVWGVEPSKPFRDRALERAEIDAGRLQHAAVEAADFSPEFFDLVSFGAVLEHLVDPSAAILKAISWLRPGGLVHVEVPSSAWLTNRIVNWLYRLQGTDYVANLSPLHPPFHLYEFGLQSFIAHAVAHGYEVLEHRRYVCATYLPPCLDPIAKPLMAATNTGMQLEVWLRKTSLLYASRARNGCDRAPSV